MKQVKMGNAMVVAVLLLALAGSACTRSGASELYDTARFEEVQHNRGHARELYEEIVRKYPNSEYAKKAQERLADLKAKEGG
jgi:outer membrane protein assembly factor BamD (BamD/ComL family)